ncbi:hypothetical protein AMST5_02977 [freshwater sediment metagenome]|uniref:Uncharacterized protein n=1 Tax=freshwater sediment metagenome TaxID=556182 RepID=A0AA48M4G3_9ZZZZ
MTISPRRSRVVILVKALPQPSKKYGETVCCAGVTAERQWKRLFPVRFRHLKGESSFSRWHWVSFNYGPPKSDTREESCHVHEESITIEGELRETERVRLLNPMLVGSAKAAAEKGHSLALIRPRNTRFLWKEKTRAELVEEREVYRFAARQTDLFDDEELAELEPTPYSFSFKFEDESGRHHYHNGDWEAHAMFWRKSQEASVTEALRWMDSVFNETYPKKGMAFALGNMAKRPQTWQLLGVIRLNDAVQGELF